jgi:hypothetical protein
MAHPDVDQLLAPGGEARIGEALDRAGASREIVAAQMCGRWRNGVPYGASPDAQWPDKQISKDQFRLRSRFAMPRRLAHAARQAARRHDRPADRQLHPAAGAARHAL